MEVNKITKQISGKRVAQVEASGSDQLVIHFIDGSALHVKLRGQRLALEFLSQADAGGCPAALRPTPRQREYLEFIGRYIELFGRSPAETDIQRHFLVSAPSVHSMVERLDDNGFITRQRGVPRTIRLAEPAECKICGGKHLLKEGIAKGSRRG